MIIDIEDDLFLQVKKIVKSRSKTIYEELDKIKPLETIPNNTLQTARDIKTQRVKQCIKETIKNLYSEDITVSKYQIHKRTGIAYVTLNKYYDGILQEVKNED
jgi:hypothetical protein